MYFTRIPTHIPTIFKWEYEIHRRACNICLFEPLSHFRYLTICSYIFTFNMIPFMYFPVKYRSRRIIIAL